MTPKFHFDEHMPNAAARELRRRGLDVTTSPEEGLVGKDDWVQLAHAATAGRVMMTCDSDYVRLHNRGQSHDGIIYWTRGNDDVGGIVTNAVLLAKVY